MSSASGGREPEQERGSAEGREPTDDELRAAYEAQIKQIRVEHVLLEHVVTVANLGMRRTGLAPGTEDERDLEQVRLAIEAIRTLLPLLEQSAPGQAPQIRDALSQLQLAFVRIGGSQGAPGEPDESPSSEPEQPGAPEAGEPAPPKPGEPPPEPGEAGPAQRSGRLWVPGR